MIKFTVNERTARVIKIKKQIKSEHGSYLIGVLGGKKISAPFGTDSFLSLVFIFLLNYINQYAKCVEDAACYNE